MRKKILVVDDERHILKAIKFYLEDEDYDVMVAESGQEALEIAESSNPDLVILDVMMPSMDGFEVCRELRARRKTHLIPIIFLTARDGVEDKVMGFELGGDDYITKPFNHRELLARIKSRLKRSEEDLYAHPVTGLPGGSVIEREANLWIQSGKPLAALFISLDHFDHYRRAYGVGMGNRLLKYTARLLAKAVGDHEGVKDFVGQNQEDEFIILTSPERSRQCSKKILDLFDRGVEEFVQDSHRNKGEITYYNFQGELVHAPFPRLVIACLNNSRRFVATYSALAQWAAQVMIKAKTKEGSCCLMEE